MAAVNLYLANQWLLKAMTDGAVCLVVSLEMSPKATLSRMWRQASLDVEPTLILGWSLPDGLMVSCGSMTNKGLLTSEH